MRVGKIVENILKGGGTEKRGEEAKILKMGASCVKGWVSLKGGGGDWIPLMNYEVLFNEISRYNKIHCPKPLAPSVPILFYIRINTSGVNIRPALQKSWYSFHKVENIKKLILQQ